MSGYKTKSSKIGYKDKWITIRADDIIFPDGREGTYSILETNGPSVFIVALTDKHEVYFIEQFRYPTQMISLELPGGSSDRQDIVQAAQRELKEETGLEAREWDVVGKSQVMNGVTNEMQYTLLARDLVQTKENKQEEEGITNVKSISITKVLKMIKNGEITDEQSIAGVFQALLFLGYRMEQ
jgi:8-oxo-dGTP pyrophosphatase MutT (NUDIX family)